ncbi:hypothetical protein [Antarcticimicrobium sediminis]|uniref:Uncharacterized protein n=1 Tax=Antarcticimicrobium sediminis TaxID=2546227 RepID=A0A4R5EIK0_9RHOB|nr:hypothetical protein [Antarcticimicrobium sediminis]TDE34153.1 hypothetical protein E1B25_20400 [Antarcticimicrobium sediminis]
MAMRARPNPTPCETGQTAGVSSLRTPGAFFRRFRKGGADAATRPVRPQALFPDQQWLVTFRRPNGDMVTKAVLINGGNLQADIKVLARLALRDQRDIDCAHLLRVQIDLNPTPASTEALDSITSAYSARLRFEADCG